MSKLFEHKEMQVQRCIYTSDLLMPKTLAIYWCLKRKNVCTYLGSLGLKEKTEKFDVMLTKEPR